MNEESCYDFCNFKVSTGCLESFPCKHRVVSEDCGDGLMDGVQILQEMIKRGIDPPQHFKDYENFEPFPSFVSQESPKPKPERYEMVGFQCRVFQIDKECKKDFHPCNHNVITMCDGIMKEEKMMDANQIVNYLRKNAVGDSDIPKHFFDHFIRRHIIG